MYENTVSRYLTMMNVLLNEPKHRFSQASGNVPREPGVYIIHDEKEKTIIYAGRTRNLRRRLLGDHKQGNIRGSQFRKALRQNRNLDSESQITRYILQNCNFQFTVVNEFEQLVRLEHFTIAVLAPVLNTQLKL